MRYTFSRVIGAKGSSANCRSTTVLTALSKVVSPLPDEHVRDREAWGKSVKRRKSGSETLTTCSSTLKSADKSSARSVAVVAGRVNRRSSNGTYFSSSREIRAIRRQVQESWF